MLSFLAQSQPDANYVQCNQLTVDVTRKKLLLFCTPATVRGLLQLRVPVPVPIPAVMVDYPLVVVTRAMSRFSVLVAFEAAERRTRGMRNLRIT